MSLHRGVVATTDVRSLLKLSCFVFGQSLLQITWGLKLWFLSLTSIPTTRSRVSSSSTTFGFGLVETCNDALIMCLDNLFWDTFHTKDFHLQSLSVW